MRALMGCWRGADEAGATGGTPRRLAGQRDPARSARRDAEGHGMTRPAYPFAAIVGQEQLKMALLLAAVDWRLGVLLRGDKGAGKTTTTRGLAALPPETAPFIIVPIRG